MAMALLAGAVLTGIATVWVIYAMANIGGAAIGASIGAIVAEVVSLTAGFWAAGLMMVAVALGTWRAVAAIRES